MEVQNPRFIPSGLANRIEMKEQQLEISRSAVFEDSWSDSFETVAGVDQAFLEDMVLSAVVVSREGGVVQRSHGVAPIEIPYIPGLLAFREGKSVVEVLQKQQISPDVLLLDGSGRIHFREAGIATHIGVIFDVPSIGVAKNLLCGVPGEPLDEPLTEGERVPILADDSVEARNNEVLGYAYQSKQYSSSDRHVNPLYVSPGHRMSPGTAVDVVEEYCRSYKLPEPIRLADKYADKVKRGFPENSL